MSTPKTRRGTAIEAAVEAPITLGSPRAFGWIMAIAFAVLAAMAWSKGNPVSRWLGLAALLFALAAWWVPAWLAPANRAWMAFGLLLGRIMTPLIMGLIYFGLITPIALLARMRGLDPMKRRFDPAATSYWIKRDPPGPDPASMDRQY